jgi:cytochrome P450
MACGLWELAKNPEVQTKLRAELDTNATAKGNADFTAVELENMPYLNAVLKVIRLGDNAKASTKWTTQEILRFHSPVPEFTRQASEDNVLPLSTPIIGSSGRTYRELNISKGTIVHVSMTGYNM